MVCDRIRREREFLRNTSIYTVYLYDAVFSGGEVFHCFDDEFAGPVYDEVYSMYDELRGFADSLTEDVLAGIREAGLTEQFGRIGMHLEVYVDEPQIVKYLDSSLEEAIAREARFLLGMSYAMSRRVMEAAMGVLASSALCGSELLVRVCERHGIDCVPLLSHLIETVKGWKPDVLLKIVATHVTTTRVTIESDVALHSTGRYAISGDVTYIYVDVDMRVPYYVEVIYAGSGQMPVAYTRIAGGLKDVVIKLTSIGTGGFGRHASTTMEFQYDMALHLGKTIEISGAYIDGTKTSVVATPCSLSPSN